jgi:D-alanine-D-alanine ligase
MGMTPQSLGHSPRELPVFRTFTEPADVERVRRLAESTGVFRADEVDVAEELVQERLSRGEASGYHFLFAEAEGATLGYACYGPIACTLGSYDLYWIVVAANQQRRGIGRRLLAEVERRVALAGGRRLYIETSSRPAYLPTREFYHRCGYRIDARLPDFYAEGDDKVIFRKVLTPAPHGPRAVRPETEIP